MGNQAGTSQRRSQTVAGLFRDRESAERAYNSLAERGYSNEEINVIMSEETREKHFSDAGGETEFGSKAMEGAGKGSAIGGTAEAVIGAIAAVGTSVAIPGLGLLVAGPIAGALVGSGIPEDRAKRYEEGVRQGGIVVGFSARDERDAEYFERRRRAPLSSLWRAPCYHPLTQSGVA